jgi:glycosyltransferase involved in cell wall biosynthesis
MASQATAKTDRPLIAIVTETFAPDVNGVAHTLNQITRNLAEKCDIQIIHPRQPTNIAGMGGSQSDVANRPNRNNDPAANLSTTRPKISQIEVTGFPIPNYPELRFGLPCRRRIQNLWLTTKPNGIYVATQGPLGWSAVSAASRLKMPVVSGFHTNFHNYSHFYGMGWLTKLIQKYLVCFHQRTKFTLVPTSQVAEAITAMGITNARVCSRGIDHKLFNPAYRSEGLRQQWGADSDTPVFIYVGRLASEKNVLLSMAAFSRVRQQVPQARMILVGGGPWQQKIANQYPWVLVTGVKRGTELATYYASADVFLFPSLTETFGNVILEAAASGLAIVSYNIAAAKEHLTHQENALLAEPGDENQFCQFSLDLATRPGELARIRKNTQKFCLSLSWQAIAEQFYNYLILATHEGGINEIRSDSRLVQTR